MDSISSNFMLYNLVEGCYNDYRRVEELYKRHG